MRGGQAVVVVRQTKRAWRVAAGLLAWLGLHPGQASAADLPEHPLLKACAQLAPACVEALETQALQAHPALAQRSGGLLRLSATPGMAPLQLNDPPGAVAHRYLGPLPGTELQLVVEMPPHGAPRFLPVGPGMASSVRFNAAPWPSPDGRLLAVAVGATAGQVGQLALWGRVGPQWRMLYSFDPDPGMGFEFKGWRGDGAALRLSWHCPRQTGATQLRDGPYGWDLVPTPPAHCDN